MVSEESLLRAREISKEEQKLEAIRAKEKEEQEALAQEVLLHQPHKFNPNYEDHVTIISKIDWFGKIDFLK